MDGRQGWLTRGAAHAACPAAWIPAPPGAQSTCGMAFCAKVARPAAEIDKTMQGHIPAVSVRLLAVLSELVWTSQQRGAGAGGEGKNGNGTKISCARPLVHDKEQRQPEKQHKPITAY